MTVRFLSTTRDLLVLGARRLLGARLWAALQFVGIAVLISIGLLWTRIPEKNAFEVALTLFVPLLVAAGFLALQAAYLRSLLREPAEPEQHEVSLALGALTLLLWIAIGWILWNFIDRFDANDYQWAMYLNSRFDPDMRSRILTYDHLSKGFDYAAWLLRWVLVPGVLLPLGCTAFYGLRRGPWRRILRVWIAWRWWLVVLLLALIGDVLPRYFFVGDPKGSVQAQVWRVILKLIAAYIVSVLCWILALAWSAALVISPLEASPSSPAAIISGRLEGRPLPVGNADENLSGNA
ncbi:hypothetical protein [Occallatibacter riparius]|uniref:Uncharacterized protein n=1 Tax=Occallatibacter riparius TaxID=1002689 RepID=A0A9J7BKH4_9BACT|nr:hypothetical protein [Occallatibacter riparius]UWZ82282.1 hypothetical protein MOP44_17070 [Occallatibacter riparius]